MVAVGVGTLAGSYGEAVGTGVGVGFGGIGVAVGGGVAVGMTVRTALTLASTVATMSGVGSLLLHPASSMSDVRSRSMAMALSRVFPITLKFTTLLPT